MTWAAMYNDCRSLAASLQAHTVLLLQEMCEHLQQSAAPAVVVVASFSLLTLCPGFNTSKPGVMSRMCALRTHKDLKTVGTASTMFECVIWLRNADANPSCVPRLCKVDMQPHHAGITDMTLLASV